MAFNYTITTTKKTFFITIFITLLLFTSGAVFANGEHTHESQIGEGKELVENEASCDQLTDEQLEAVGDYLMEQMHPGESHTVVHQMMGIEEGTEYHKVFHINLAKTMYCGQNGMPMTQMMPMMQQMMGGNTAMDTTGNMMPWIGMRMLGGGFWQWIIAGTFLVWLIVGVLATIWLWKQINKKNL